MTIVLVVGGLLAAWCLLPLPLAVAVGRSFRAGAAPAQPVDDVIA